MQAAHRQEGGDALLAKVAALFAQSHRVSSVRQEKHTNELRLPCQHTSVATAGLLLSCLSFTPPCGAAQTSHLHQLVRDDGRTLLPQTVGVRWHAAGRDAANVCARQREGRWAVALSGWKAINACGNNAGGRCRCLQRSATKEPWPLYDPASVTPGWEVCECMPL